MPHLVISLKSDCLPKVKLHMDENRVNQELRGILTSLPSRAPKEDVWRGPKHSDGNLGI